jgi:hypothetical protein
MSEVLLGAAIGAVFSFLGGLVLGYIQERRTRTLTLSLRALELQEPALRKLNSLLLGFISLEGLPFEDPPVGSHAMGIWSHEWKEFLAVADRIGYVWDAELGPAVYDDGVASAVADFRDQASAVRDALETYRETRDPTDLRVQGADLVTVAAHLRDAINRARRVR